MSDLESFGVREIDELMGGGILPGAIYLMEFEQGTEELAFVAAYLNEALQKGELIALRVYYLPYPQMMKNLEKFGFNSSAALNSGSMLISDLSKEERASCPNTGPINRSGDLKNPGAILEHYNVFAEVAERERVARTKEQ